MLARCRNLGSWRYPFLSGTAIATSILPYATQSSRAPLDLPATFGGFSMSHLARLSMSATFFLRSRETLAAANRIEAVVHWCGASA
jgi:hypothetical protein